MARLRRSNPIRDNLKGILIGSAAALVVAAACWFFLGRGSDKDVSSTTTPIDNFPYTSPWAEYPTELPPPHVLVEVDETYYNDSVEGATPTAMFQRVTGNLSASDDVDFYSFTIDVPGSVNFSFSFDGSDNGYTYLWNAAVYGTDGWTELNSGGIPSKKGEAVTFSAHDLTPGTYFLKISRASGGNPFMNGYSDTNYHIAFLPECAEHASVTQVLTVAPTCSQAGELTSVCNICDMVLDPEPLEPLDHIWSTWETVEELSLHSLLGKRSRMCAIGGEMETETLLFHIQDRDQNADEGNILGDIWAFISNHPVIVGIIVFFVVVAIFGKKDDDGIGVKSYGSSGAHSGYHEPDVFNASEYVRRNCKSQIYGLVSDRDIETIERDSDLSWEEKEEAKTELERQARRYY